MNPSFEAEFNALLLDLDLNTLTIEQAKTVIDVMIFMTKIRMMNLEIQKQFFEKVNAKFEEEPEEMINFTKKLVYGLFNPIYKNDEIDSETEGNRFPLISIYANLSPQHFNKFSVELRKLCSTFESVDYKEQSGYEKPIIFMATGIPMKSFIEFLNK
jgi:hypothetical protein